MSTNPHIEPRIGVSATEYRISGQLDQVLKAIAALFSQYHPSGYGTQVHAIQHHDGHYVARVSRSNSCE